MFRKLVATEKSTKFRECTRVVTCDTLPAIRPTEVLVQPRFVGINASDINFTAGKYKPNVKPPFDCGFECVGTVLAAGARVSRVKVGDPVGVVSFGAFSEVFKTHESAVFRIPSIQPKYLPLLVSGLTASMALEQAAQLKGGETVLVTAAAGGTGVFAVQLAKLAGCKVIATCSSDAKVDMLKSLGADHVVNTSSVTGTLSETFASLAPSGFHVVYECVGGDQFDAAVDNLAKFGRIVVIGQISGYQDGDAWSARRGGNLPMRLLSTSGSVVGFFLNHYLRHAERHLAQLIALVDSGKIVPVLDSAPFSGLDAIADAVDRLYSRKSIGKVFVEIPPLSTVGALQAAVSKL